MPLPDLDPARAPELLFGDILAYVEAADAMVSARDTVSLAGLDTALEALCARVTAMDPNDGKEYAPELEHLMARINELQEKMLRLRDEVATTLQSVGVQKKANRAYNSAPTGKVDT
jgi:hypothetical protein